MVDHELARLAELYGVALGFHDYQGNWHEASDPALRAILDAMDVPAGDREAVVSSLTAKESQRWRRMVEPTVVVRAGGPAEVGVRLPRGATATLSLALETGGVHESHVTPDEHAWTAAEVDGVQIVEAVAHLGELPLGYHQLSVVAGRRHDSCHFIVAPREIPWPESTGRVEGWMLQLYAMRSSRSWGIGDLTDLAALASWSAADLGFGAVLVNPLHAVSPLLPLQRSPYYPSSKLYTNPLYVDPDAIPEAQLLDDEGSGELARLAETARESCRELIDRDAVWRAKMAAFERLHAVARTPERERDYAAYRAREGSRLDDFATFCALAERHGGAWPDWPEDLQDPRSAAVAKERHELADRVDLHRWLQFVCDEQLSASQRAAREKGMPIGIIHDLAIGVDPGGADAWTMRDELALGVTVGAPPDLYAHEGQNWSQPPLRPDRLRDTGYAAYRDMLRASLRHGGGIRIDHVLGLFRLFWIPVGSSASEGTYVHYAFDELLGVLVLEAARAGAIVVGEDLGTVPDGLRDALRANGILRSAVLYFQRDYEHSVPLPPEEWAELSLATVNTHDLSTAAGFVTGQRVPLYQQLGLLDDEQADNERRQEDHERGQLIEQMHRYGVIPADSSTSDLVEGMHALLAKSPCRLVLAALWDAVGDIRQLNVPGTGDGVYPNWCLPLAQSDGTTAVPITLEQVQRHDGVRRVAEALRGRTLPDQPR